MIRQRNSTGHSSPQASMKANLIPLPGSGLPLQTMRGDFGLQRRWWPFLARPPLLAKKPDVVAKPRVLLLDILVRPGHQIVGLMVWTHLFSVESQTPKSNETCGRVKPLQIVPRTASRRNSSVYLFAIPYLRQSKHCSKETGTKPRQKHSL